MLETAFRWEPEPCRELLEVGDGFLRWYCKLPAELLRGDFFDFLWNY